MFPLCFALFPHQRLTHELHCLLCLQYNPEDNKYIRPFVIRDFHVMRGIGYEDEMNSVSDGRRAHVHVNPTIEMTESGHFNNVGGKKLVRNNSLFDYGHNN
jgi:hypothetical protein